MELCLSLGIFLTLTLGMVDLGIGVFRYHILENASRHAARRASVHGERALSSFGNWGTATITATASDTGVAVIDGPDGIAPLLTTCDLSQTNVTVEWPDGDDKVGQQVRVTVSSPYTPLFAFIFPNGTITLTAVSTMMISH